MTSTMTKPRSRSRDQFDPETASDAQRLAKIVTLTASAKMARAQGRRHDAFELLQSAVTVADYLPDDLRKNQEMAILGLANQWRRLV